MSVRDGNDLKRPGDSSEVELGGSMSGTYDRERSQSMHINVQIFVFLQLARGKSSRTPKVTRTLSKRKLFNQPVRQPPRLVFHTLPKNPNAECHCNDNEQHHFATESSGETDKPVNTYDMCVKLAFDLFEAVSSLGLARGLRS